MFAVNSEAAEALQCLRAAGYEAFLVGGCVRDALRGAPVHDWDITTNASPAEVQAVFSHAAVVPTGAAHGTVTVVLRGEALEVTTYRVDGAYSDGRRPDSVRFTPSLTEDLARRDFTMNAIAYCPGEGLRDPFGGQADLAAGCIRCVGEARQRFAEDALRILRALRFAAQTGFCIDAATDAALRACAPLLHRIAAERIFAELTKLLCGPHAGDVLRSYAEVLFAVVPQLAPMHGFLQHNPHHCFDVWRHTAAVVENSPPAPAARWAALLHDAGKPACFTRGTDGVGHFYGHAAESARIAQEVLHGLHCDNATRLAVVDLIRRHDTPVPTDEKGIRRCLARMGEARLSQLIALQRADNLGQAEAFRARQALFDAAQETVAEVLRQDACFSLRQLAVRGGDLTARGLAGPAVGNALRLLLDAVLDGRVPNEKNALLAYLAQQQQSL